MFTLVPTVLLAISATTTTINALGFPLYDGITYQRPGYQTGYGNGYVPPYYNSFYNNGFAPTPTYPNVGYGLNGYGYNTNGFGYNTNGYRGQYPILFGYQTGFRPGYAYAGRRPTFYHNNYTPSNHNGYNSNTNGYHDSNYYSGIRRTNTEIPTGSNLYTTPAYGNGVNSAYSTPIYSNNQRK